MFSSPSQEEPSGGTSSPAPPSPLSFGRPGQRTEVEDSDELIESFLHRLSGSQDTQFITHLTGQQNVILNIIMYN